MTDSTTFMPTSLGKQLDEVADSLAAELLRQFQGLKHLSAEKQRQHAMREIRHVLEEYENIVFHLSEKAEQEKALCRFGFTDWARDKQRIANIKSRHGYSYGCDICHGGLEVKTFLTLLIGNYKGRLMLDMCKACAARLANVIDARFDDGRVTEK